MQLNAEGRQRFQAHLQKVLRTPCAVCGGGNWQIEDAIFELREFAGGGLNPFFGTSAAAPHAAGIAAVLLSCSTRPSPQQVKAALLRSTIPIGAPQPSDVSGYGIVMASDVAVPPLCRQQLAAE